MQFLNLSSWRGVKVGYSSNKRSNCKTSVDCNATAACAALLNNHQAFKWVRFLGVNEPHQLRPTRFHQRRMLQSNARLAPPAIPCSKAAQVKSDAGACGLVCAGHCIAIATARYLGPLLDEGLGGVCLIFSTAVEIIGRKNSLLRMMQQARLRRMQSVPAAGAMESRRNRQQSVGVARLSSFF
jgi:hypothetical protein